MKKVAFLGSKNIGLKCLKILNTYTRPLNYQIVGVLTNPRGEKIIEYANENKLFLLQSLDDYLSLAHVDIAISIQYHEILKKKHIEKAHEITINLHMAPLPEYRGCNQFSFAILNNDNVFGTTIHKVDEGIDSGDILFEHRFDVPNKSWVDDLYKITFDKSIELFENNLKNIITGNYQPRSQSSFIDERGCSIHYRDEINKMKIIDLDWDRDKIERHIRATYMPGFEPPYTIINGRKTYFTRGSND